LYIKYDEPLSIAYFNFNLRHYTKSLQALAGAMVYLLKLGSGEMRAAMMPWHRFFGAATFIMGGGLHSSTFQLNLSHF